MAWTIKYHEKRPEVPVVGDMWPAPWFLEGPETSRNYWVSKQYDKDWADKRPPLVVKLPGGHEHCVDMGGSGNREGWTVTGSPPKITVVPSINVHGIYHGWIRDGVITDDCEGRKFE
jgi:hypothetical protein